MQTELISLKDGKAKRVSLTENFDKVFIDPSVRPSVEYARARIAIQEDYKKNFAMNQPMAKNLRRKCKRVAVEALKGKVETRFEPDRKDPEKKNKVLMVKFPDGSEARL